MKRPKQNIRSAGGKHRAARTKGKKRLAPRTSDQYFAMPERNQAQWDRIVGVVSKMRSEGASLQQAAHAAEVSPRTVLRWTGTALQKRTNGRYAAKPSDGLLRVLMVPTPEGTREIAVRGSRQAAQLAEYWNAVHRYLQTGDATRLQEFQGKTVKDAEGKLIPLPTDRRELNRLGSAGVLSFESLYARSA
jgi:hypothetical protein